MIQKIQEPSSDQQENDNNTTNMSLVGADWQSMMQQSMGIKEF